MDDDTREILEMLLQMAVLYAPQVPTPDRPPCDATEKATDEYCLRLIRHGEAEEPSDMVAEALVPRLTFALHHGSAVCSAHEKLAKAGDTAATDETLLEWLLIRFWHQRWKTLWLT